MEWNGHPDRNPCSYSHPMFHKDGKNTYCRKYRLYQQMVLEKPELSICRRMKLCTSINSKWSKDLMQGLKLEVLGGNMARSRCRQRLPERTLPAQERRPGTEK